MEGHAQGREAPSEAPGRRENFKRGLLRVPNFTCKCVHFGVFLASFV